MRTTLRVIAAAFALLLATPALGASEFDIANAEHDANTGASNGAKRVTPVDASGTSLVSGGLKSVIVDTSGDSAVDATANAVKTVDVDNAGAALVGGRGSRVELLASGTDTTVATAAATLASVPVPAWAHSVVFMARMDAVTTPGTGFQCYVSQHISDSYETIGSALWLSTAALTPAVGDGCFIMMGAASPVGQPAALTTVTSIAMAQSSVMFRYLRFGRYYATASASTSIRWFVYGIG